MFLGCKTSSKNNDITTVNVDRKMIEYSNDTDIEKRTEEYLYNVDIETRNDKPQTAHMYNQLALGFNTREYIDFHIGKTREYYILNKDKYSNVQISELKGFVNPGQEVRYEFYSDPNTYFILTFNGGADIVGMNSLVRIKRIGPLTITAQDNKVILEYENDLTDFWIKGGGIIRGRAWNPFMCFPVNKEILYNTPENEIEHIYLTLFVKYMLRLINLEHFESTVRYNETTYNMEHNELVKLFISRFKKHELSIIRNLLFARHKYAFRTEFWQDFINTYYPKTYGGIFQDGNIFPLSSYRKEDWMNFMDNYYHGDYVGLYTESDVISRFNWFERRLLEIIIEYENN
jgi:hypothetical protein